MIVRFTFFYVMFIMLSLSNLVFGHCQIPCGIYDDDRVFSEIIQDAETIKKSILMINELSKTNENSNQLVRWVTNKENHAKNIQSIMNDYFLSQRIKIPPKNSEQYDKLLHKIHYIIVYAMKTKQSDNLKIADDLIKSIENFKNQYKSSK